jgi:hypothetical protein
MGGLDAETFRGFQLAGELFLLTSFFIEPKDLPGSENVRIWGVLCGTQPFRPVASLSGNSGEGANFGHFDVNYACSESTEKSTTARWGLLAPRRGHVSNFYGPTASFRLKPGLRV